MIPRQNMLLSKSELQSKAQTWESLVDWLVDWHGPFLTIEIDWLIDWLNEWDVVFSFSRLHYFDEAAAESNPNAEEVTYNPLPIANKCFYVEGFTIFSDEYSLKPMAGLNPATSPETNSTSLEVFSPWFLFYSLYFTVFLPLETIIMTSDWSEFRLLFHHRLRNSTIPLRISDLLIRPTRMSPFPWPEATLHWSMRVSPLWTPVAATIWCRWRCVMAPRRYGWRLSRAVKRRDQRFVRTGGGGGICPHNTVMDANEIPCVVWTGRTCWNFTRCDLAEAVGDSSHSFQRGLGRKTTR